jgi:hypothetical protein
VVIACALSSCGRRELERETTDAAAPALPGAPEAPAASPLGEIRGAATTRGVAVRFDARAVHLEGGAWRWATTLVRWGHGHATREAPRATPSSADGRVRYDRGAIDEWYVERAHGLEQGFDVRARPEGSAALRLELASEGLTPVLVDGRVALRDERASTIAFYGGLHVEDARGRTVPAELRVEAGTIVIVIDDAGADYPLRVDPLVWALQEQRIAPAALVSGDQFGSSVAVSHDTLVVGGNGDGATARPGSAQIFVRGATGWEPQAQLVVPGLPTTVYAYFGDASAIDGDTVVVGAKLQGNRGSAYVFVRSGTSWTFQAELVPTPYDGALRDYGQAVAVRGDTAVVSSRRSGAYVFTRVGSSWSQQANLDCAFGVALAGDTIVCGERPALPANPQAAKVYVRAAGSWTLQATLTSTSVGVDDGFGDTVALSGDSAVVGAPWQSSSTGSVYVFVRSGTTWTEQAKLQPVGVLEGDQLGAAVAVDGDALVAGAWGQRKLAGGAYFFARSGTTWAEQARVQPRDLVPEDRFGTSVSIDGAIAAVGAPRVAASAGAAYVFSTGLGLGDACAADRDCVSGHCVDAVCCGEASCSTCATCAGSGACHARALGAAPTSSCGVYLCDGASVACPTKCAKSDGCAAGYACDSGACTKLPIAGACRANEECLSGFCTDGACCNVAACALGTSCAVPGHAGSCAKGAGASCTADAECGTGHCADGVCCSGACAGQCEACDVTGAVGTCTPVSGAPHGTRAACSDGGGSACAARSCDGAKDRTSCAGYVDGASIACGASICLGAKFTGASSCDGGGRCVAPATSSCAPYACDGKGCLTTCDGDAQCAAGFQCSGPGGTCFQGPHCSDDGASSIAPDGQATACAPYRCGTSGACNAECATTRDCAPSAGCDGVHCVELQSVQSAAGGCSVSTGGDERDGDHRATFVGLAAGAIALGLTRRRAARRRGTRRRERSEHAARATRPGRPGAGGAR